LLDGLPQTARSFLPVFSPPPHLTSMFSMPAMDDSRLLLLKCLRRTVCDVITTSLVRPNAPSFNPTTPYVPDPFLVPSTPRERTLQPNFFIFSAPLTTGFSLYFPQGVVFGALSFKPSMKPGPTTPSSDFLLVFCVCLRDFPDQKLPLRFRLFVQRPPPFEGFVSLRVSPHFPFQHP